MATRRQTFRLYPNKQQENKLFEARRNHAYLYNACIAHRRYEWRAAQKTVTYGSVMVLYNVATNSQPGLGTRLVDYGCFSSTNSTSKRKYTGSMRQLKQVKSQKPNRSSDGGTETPSVTCGGVVHIIMPVRCLK